MCLLLQGHRFPLIYSRRVQQLLSSELGIAFNSSLSCGSACIPEGLVPMHLWDRRLICRCKHRLPTQQCPESAQISSSDSSSLVPALLRSSLASRQSRASSLSGDSSRTGSVIAKSRFPYLVLTLLVGSQALPGSLQSALFQFRVYSDDSVSSRSSEGGAASRQVHRVSRLKIPTRRPATPADGAKKWRASQRSCAQGMSGCCWIGPNSVDNKEVQAMIRGGLMLSRK